MEEEIKEGQKQRTIAKEEVERGEGRGEGEDEDRWIDEENKRGRGEERR